MHNFRPFLLVLMLFFFSCKEEEKQKPFVKPSSSSLLILNEGNFGWNNASIGIYTWEDSLYQADIFKKQNSRPLGDVLQSAMLYQEELFLIVNNSTAIEVVSPIDFKHKRTIQGISSPRYMLPVPGILQAWITDLYADKIFKIDLLTGTKLDSVFVEGWNEQICLWTENEFIFSNLLKNCLYFFDPHAAVIKDSIFLDGEPRHLQKSTQGDLYFVVNQSNGSISNIYKLEKSTKEKISYFQSNTRITQMCVGSSGELYFVSDNKLFKSTTIGMVNFLAELPPSSNIYAMYYDVKQQQILLSNAGNFVQKGKIYFYDTSGKWRRTIEAEIIPNGFLPLD
jgi:hypothetical protein